LADVVVVSVHCHEGAADGWNSPQVPDFLTTATHAWIDAGADAVIGHGPHQIRGIEIYQGRPILYSLGNFAFTNATTPFLPPEGYLRQGLDPERSSLVEYADSAVGGGFPAHEQYWRSVVAQLGFDDSGVRLDLLPLSLRRDAERWVRGIPQLADEEEGRHILGILAELSAPFGTRIDVEESGSRVVGRVRMTPSRAVTTPDQEAS
jgi:poly-gamma-glutamate synthesis protein (capsule biosynthesis protein)